MGRGQEAEALAREGLAILEPFVARHPDVHGALAEQLRKKLV